MHIQFLGANGTVTGSKYLVRAGRSQVLVDCGLFEGYKQHRLRNWEGLPVSPAELDAVILTQADLDHSGYLPVLVRNGFRGTIFCSEATYDLCKILLPDKGLQLEEEASHANRHGFSKHSPALALYGEADARDALRLFAPVAFATPFQPSGGFTARFAPGGHILGASIVQLTAHGRTITFSGDLGRPNDPLMAPPARIEHTDYLVVESTYGNRRHDPTDPAVLLGRTLRDTAARGGVTLIAAATLGRAQSLIYQMHLLKQSGQIPALLPVYLDSPLARDASALFQTHGADHRLGAGQCAALRQGITIVNSMHESIALNAQRAPMVLIAGSAMASGGRVLRHLAAFASDPRNTILFAGCQAGGTRGAALLAGRSIKIHGEHVPLRAQVVQVHNLSGHADGDEILGWLAHFRHPPRQTFITHGEPDAADELRQRIAQQLNWNCRVPSYSDSMELA